MKAKKLKVALSVGELSGDQHAARVVDALKKFHPDCEFRGMGGRFLRTSGVKTDVDSEISASLNGFNLFLIVWKSVGALLRLTTLLVRWKPDILVLVDYPDFNLILARIAKVLGIPVMYFIPPKVWVWRKYRMRTIKKTVDRVALILPMEKDFYESLSYSNATYVGHPIVDSTAPGPLPPQERAEYLTQIGLNPNHPVLALFAGSRDSEVRRHLPILAPALTCLKEKHPNLQVLVAVAPTIPVSRFEEAGLHKEWCKAVTDDSLTVLKVADAGLLKSGTCNLEAAYCRLPFVCFYTCSRFAEFIVRKLTDIKVFSLVNLIRPNSVPELMQQDATTDKIIAELEPLLSASTQRETMLTNLDQVITALRAHDIEGTSLNESTSSERTAHSILQLAQSHLRPRGLAQRVPRYLKPYKKHFAMALLCMVLFGASDGIVPFLIQHILDGVFTDQNQRLLTLIPVVLIAFAVVRAFVDFGQQYLMARIGHNIVRDLRNEMNSHLLKLSPGYFVAHSTGNILSRFTSDVLLVKDLLTNSVASIIRDTIRVVALLIAAVYLDPVLAVIAFIVFPIGLVPVYRFGKKMRKLSKYGQDAIGSLSGLIQENVLGNRVIKIFGRENYEQQCFTFENDRLNDTFIKSERVRALTGPVNEVLASFGICGIILYGGFSVIGGTRSQGEFIAFLLAVLLLYDPFKRLSRVNNQIQQGLSGAERIFELLDTPLDIVEPEKPVTLPDSNRIDINNVSFRYNESEPKVLDSISLRIEEGTKVAIVGFSGAGKSTLVDLIPRFLDPQEGSIAIGGVDVRSVSLAELRARIAMVHQHTFLFHDTVFNNIAYGNTNATREEVIQAARLAYAHDFISRLPKGFDSVVGESGFTLSGGERQRIAIARAILKNSPILILDEATASLDNKSEREVQAAIEKLEENRTSVVIAHRLSTIRRADLIVVLEDGKIVETGTHDELLAANGAFARLHALQFSENPQVEDRRDRVAQIVN